MWIAIILLIGLSAIAMVAAAIVLRFAVKGIPEDTIGSASNGRKGIGRRLRAWFHRKPHKLAYRRDARGRFRKIRRE